jgi:hypothetical protein
MTAETATAAELASEILALLGRDPRAASPARLSAEILQSCTRDQLLDCARRLGLTGVSKLPKEVLAGRVQVAFERLPREAPPTSGADASFPPKFDLGPSVEGAKIPEHIPWGYDQDRVTAMFVNPERLYVYWEVTDAAIEAARRELGRGGSGAWLNLRVYDITGRLFDGTNAHSYFDHKIERHDRQWFFDINKPTSTACAEVGLKSNEGFFAKIARSGRVDFPRRGPTDDGAVEWLTVRSATGYAGDRFASGAAGAGGGEAQGGAAGGGGEHGWRDWQEGAGFPAPGGQRVFDRRWQWQEGGVEQWQSELQRIEWVGPVLRTEWESGPFAYPIEAPPLVEQHDTGEVSVRTENGRVHVVYGPWQVVIRGIGARAERRVLATWEYRRTVAVTGGVERTAPTFVRVGAGASEWLMAGASERLWRGASELLFQGASELYLVGASELRLGGASETLYAGASEYRYRGASERLMRGASEWQLGGASERMAAGASERLYGGASERQVGGASERQLGGASERQQLGGASENGYPIPGRS